MLRLTALSTLCLPGSALPRSLQPADGGTPDTTLHDTNWGVSTKAPAASGTAKLQQPPPQQWPPQQEGGQQQQPPPPPQQQRQRRQQQQPPAARKNSVLLYMTSYDNAEHLRALQSCWPAIWKRSTWLQAVDLLLYIDIGPLDWVNTTTTREEWIRAAEALTSDAVVRGPIDRQHHAYQSGAMYAMYVPLQEHWFDGYEWVVRINPDVYLLDDTFTSLALQKPEVLGVFANCHCAHTCREDGLAANDLRVHTDWIAVRTGSLHIENFAKWATEENAETYLTNVGVHDIILSKSFELIQPSNEGPTPKGVPREGPGKSCRIVGPQWWHYHGDCTDPCILTGKCSGAEILRKDSAAELLLMDARSA